MFMLVAVLALGTTPALAVHLCTNTTPPLSPFIKGGLEIDDPSGNVTVQDQSCEDWQTVFGTAGSFSCSNQKVGGTAIDATCSSERLNPNATIFTGGGSKDGLDIPNWQGKDGSVPDKDNIVTAFAARYVVGTEKILYFGADRFDNNGDAQIGFWFFQNAVAFDPATGTFSGTHKNGDLLILANFTGGGDETNILALRVANYNPADGSFTFTQIA